MANYSFYIYYSKGVIEGIRLKEAIDTYKSIKKEGYTAIGVTIDDMYSCDLLNNMTDNGEPKISNDYKSMEHFKDNSLISLNVISILKREFNI